MRALLMTHKLKPKERDIDITNLKNITQYSLSWANWSAFSNDGMNFYIAINGGTNTVYQYQLNTPYDLNSYQSYKTNGIAQYSSITQVYISPDWTKIAASDRAGNWRNQGVTIQDLSTPYDISTRTNSKFQQITWWNGVRFSPDWRYMYTNNYSNVVQYELSTAWDINTLTQIASIAIPGTSEWHCVSLSPEWDYLIYNEYNYQTSTNTTYQKYLQTKWDINSYIDYKYTTNSYTRTTISTNWSHLMNECMVAEFYEK